MNKKRVIFFFFATFSTQSNLLSMFNQKISPLKTAFKLALHNSNYSLLNNQLLNNQLSKTYNNNINKNYSKITTSDSKEFFVAKNLLNNSETLKNMLNENLENNNNTIDLPKVSSKTLSLILHALRQLETINNNDIQEIIDTVLKNKNAQQSLEFFNSINFLNIKKFIKPTIKSILLKKLNQAELSNYIQIIKNLNQEKFYIKSILNQKNSDKKIESFFEKHYGTFLNFNPNTFNHENICLQLKNRTLTIYKKIFGIKLLIRPIQTIKKVNYVYADENNLYIFKEEYGETYEVKIFKLNPLQEICNIKAKDYNKKPTFSTIISQFSINKDYFIISIIEQKYYSNGPKLEENETITFLIQDKNFIKPTESINIKRDLITNDYKNFTIKTLLINSQILATLDYQSKLPDNVNLTNNNIIVPLIPLDIDQYPIYHGWIETGYFFRDFKIKSMKETIVNNLKLIENKTQFNFENLNITQKFYLRENFPDVFKEIYEKDKNSIK